jgi:hypothetical protein
VGIYGNEIADRLAKEAARSKDTDIALGRIPISTLYYELEEEFRQRWQKEWGNCAKADITKQYSPTVQERLNMKIRVTQNIASMVTARENQGLPPSIQVTGKRYVRLQTRRPNSISPTLPVHSVAHTKRNPEEEHHKHRTLTCKQTEINYEAPGIVHKLHRINRF